MQSATVHSCKRKEKYGKVYLLKHTNSKSTAEILKVAWMNVVPEYVSLKEIQQCYDTENYTQGKKM